LAAAISRYYAQAALVALNSCGYYIRE